MTPEDVVRSQQDASNRNDLDTALTYWADEVTNHGRTAPKHVIRMILEDIAATFSEARLDIEDLVSDGDMVVVRGIASGIHTGVGKLPVNGGMLVGVPPTGKRYAVQHIHWFRFEEGKIREHWASRDDLGMMQQLGLIPKALAQ